MFYSLKMPTYEDLKVYEGYGNYTIRKYYQWPYRPFYRYKLKMIASLMPKDKVFRNCLDFGSGPGIFTPELKKHALIVKNFELTDRIDIRWKFDIIVCASVLEFISNLDYLMARFKEILVKDGYLFVGSPLKNRVTDTYFTMIKDRNLRNSHEKIIQSVRKHFKIEDYNQWLNLYFALRAKNA